MLDHDSRLDTELIQTRNKSWCTGVIQYHDGDYPYSELEVGHRAHPYLGQGSTEAIRDQDNSVLIHERHLSQNRLSLLGAYST